jgi:hypothetical protein
MVMNPHMAVLFWCYKEPSLCRDRLEWFRRYNPHTPVFVLFGGNPTDSEVFREALAGLYQDFWAHSGEPPEATLPQAVHCPSGGQAWKWYYGDLLIRDWFRDRGRGLSWDRVFVMQWDMLVLAPLDRVLAGMGAGEALFSGLRPVSEVEQKWTWTSPEKPAFRSDYLDFVRSMATDFDHHEPPLCALAVVMVLPRAFWEAFDTIPQPALGFIEYKLPTCAAAFGIPLNRSIRFSVWWDDLEPLRWHHSLRAVSIDIHPLVIALGRFLPGGPRIFHPYSKPLPKSPAGWLRLLAGRARKDLRAMLARL